MKGPNTLYMALDILAVRWRALCAELLALFPASVRPVVPEVLSRTYRIILIIAVANYVIVGIALLYAMATGQFDWSVG